MNFAQYLTSLRKRTSLTKSGLARKIKVSPSYIINIESESKEPPTRKRCDAIADALNLDKDERAKLFQLAFEARRFKFRSQSNIPQYEFNLNAKQEEKREEKRIESKKDLLIYELNRLLATADIQKIEAVLTLLRK